MKIVYMVLASFLWLGGPVYAGDLSLFNGDYSEAETPTSCASLTHVEISNQTFLIETETCVSTNSGSLTGIFTCDATSMSCVVNSNLPQQICPSASLLLLSSGNILMSNPCRGVSSEWLKVGASHLLRTPRVQ